MFEASRWTRRQIVGLIVLLEALAALYASARLLVRFQDEDTTGTLAVTPPSRRRTTTNERLTDNRTEDQKQKRTQSLDAAASSLSSFDIQDLVDKVPPRAFPPWNNGTVPLPCPMADEDWASPIVQRSKTQTGILYVKVPKTGSSTGASVSLRIASRLYEKFGPDLTTTTSSDDNSTEAIIAAVDPTARVCKNRVRHARTYSFGYDRRRRDRSVLWTLVRDPTSRAVSDYFHLHISRYGRDAHNASVFPHFVETRKHRLRSYQVAYLTFRPHVHHQNDEGVSVVSLDTVRSILRDYDFVGVSERMDESVVALQMLLGLETSDVVHLNSKISGGYDGGGFENRCVYIQPSFRTPAMQELFASRKWQRWTVWDTVLHRAANASLDLTIASLGVEKFREQLKHFQDWQRLVRDACSGQVRPPCDASRHGLPPRPHNETDCLLADSGCGFQCIDRALATTAKAEEEEE